MSNINVDNEKEISVNITLKSNYLMSSSCILLISLILIIELLFKLFSNISLFVTIFSCILVGMLFLSIFFSSLTNFITYNYRDNKDKLYKNNKVRSLYFLMEFYWIIIDIFNGIINIKIKKPIGFFYLFIFILFNTSL